MLPGNAHAVASPPTSPDPILLGEDLVRVRAGAWRLLVPMRFVERIHGAALPAARPSGGAPAAPVVAVGPEELLPVVFAEALLGAAEVRLSAAQQMVQLGERGRRALLWVDAVEDVVGHAPRQAPPEGPGPDGLVACWSGDSLPLAVIDVPRLLELASGPPERKEAP